uniref:MHC class I-like antigen recognition-like domain-containing protein n=1 Tax=Denticeps clupeoides TaxID=299321 RepID=A0AAY4CQ15_9TELE
LIQRDLQSVVTGTVPPGDTQGSRSLQYFYTGVTQGINFPEFTAVGLVDGQQFLYYDSNIRQAIPKVDWIKNNEGPEYWTRTTQIIQANEANFKVSIGTVMQRFNQSGGIHTFLQMFGCELDDETGATDGYSQFGYDGADFLYLELRSTSYVAPVKEALITKQKWDGAAAEWEKNYLTQECIDWLKKYVDYGMYSLQRKGTAAHRTTRNTNAETVYIRQSGAAAINKSQNCILCVEKPDGTGVETVPESCVCVNCPECCSCIRSVNWQVDVVKC